MYAANLVWHNFDAVKSCSQNTESLCVCVYVCVCVCVCACVCLCVLATTFTLVAYADMHAQEHVLLHGHLDSISAV